MSEILSIFSKLGSLIASVFLFLWKIIKFLFSKCWKFMLVIGSVLLSIFGISKAMKE